MQFSKILRIFSLAAAASAVTVSYDTGFDDGSRSLSVLACSDGVNGLISRYGWQTQGQVPRFPYIGGAEAVAGWNSPNVSLACSLFSFMSFFSCLTFFPPGQCGTCWRLSWNGRTIHVLAVDHSVGFNIALAALNDLTNGQAVNLGRIDAQAAQVDVGNCGL